MAHDRIANIVSTQPSPHLVSRRGYRRIIPNDESQWERQELTLQALRLAKKVLRGKEQTIFIRKLVDPLLDQPRITFAKLAKEMGCSTAQAHKLLHRAKDKIAREWELEQAREQKRLKNIIAKYLKSIGQNRR
jgi:hypothetical protein